MLTAPVEVPIDSLLESMEHDIACNIEWTRGNLCGAPAGFRGMGHNSECQTEQIFVCYDCLAKLHILRMTHPTATCFLCNQNPIIWDLRQM